MAKVLVLCFGAHLERLEDVKRRVSDGRTIEPKMLAQPLRTPKYESRSVAQILAEFWITDEEWSSCPVIVLEPDTPCGDGNPIWHDILSAMVQYLPIGHLPPDWFYEVIWAPGVKKERAALARA